MDRRHFIGVSAAGLACTARLAADQKAREPDLILEDYGGAIAFSPDSKTLAIAKGPAGDSDRICFLDAENWKRLPDFERTTDVKVTRGYGRPRVLAFSSDGKYFAAGGQGYVALWDVRSGRRLENLDPSPNKPWGTVTILSFARDSKSIFALGRFWNLQDDSATLVNGLDGPDGFAFSPDGKKFATREAGMITIWSHERLKKENTFGYEQPTGGPLLFTPDGAHVISRAVRIGERLHYFWNIENGEPKYVPFEHDLSFQFDLTRDGSLLIGADPPGLVLLAVNGGKSAYALAGKTTQYRVFTDDNSVVANRFSPNQTVVAQSRVSGLWIWKDKDGFKAPA